jgi:hypothetical protein
MRILGCSKRWLPAGLAVIGMIGAPSLGAASARAARTAVEPPTIPCAVLPADNVWNRDISSLPVHPNSDAYIDSIGRDRPLHADFGSEKTIGFPYEVVPADQALVKIKFTEAGEESDPGPYPVPRNARIEGGPKSTEDRHVLVVQADTCLLYELYGARKKKEGRLWKAGSGVRWDLSSNAMRPADWTSADAAGLPILPGLVRWDEANAGEIRHALRFTVSRTQAAYVWPARHEASNDADPNLPPMGIRVRLKDSYDVSGFSNELQVILTAMKRYGMILADNGSDWFVSGTSDPRWNDDELHEIDALTGDDFEVVDASSLMVDPDSMQAR